MSYCAPGKGSSLTCFTINGLRKIASAYNQRIAQHGGDLVKFDKNTSKQELWDDLRKKLSGECTNEWCWVDLDFVKSLNDKTLDETFRPKGPKGKWEWLKTSDINKAMKLYEETNPGFVFFGPVPIDFAEITTELNNMNIESMMKNGVKSIGIIFNMDPHDKSGSHWVAMYVDLVNKQINYFDSYGICPPPKEIRELIQNINIKAKQLYGKPFFINCNTYRHQFKNSECGVYSMYFIIESLKGRTFDNITKNIVLDDEVNKYRNLFFRPQH